MSGTKLHFTTAYHPQSDGQTEVRNRGLEQYLRAFVADKPNKWVNFLPWAELSLNCFFHEGLGTSPFKALYGREPRPLVAAEPSNFTPADVASLIRQRGELIVSLRANLERAQQRMRTAANKHRRHVEFQVGDEVLLKLQQYRQYSVAKPLSSKLARRFFGPFEVLERIGQVAYRLRLPEGSRVHNVFHVSLLRPFVQGASPESIALPPLFAQGRPVSRPLKWVDSRTVWRDGAPAEEALIQWDDDGGESPTWEPLSVVRRRFPTLILEDKNALIRGGVDTVVPPIQTEQRRTVIEEEEVEEPQAPELNCDTVERGRPSPREASNQGKPRRRTRPPVRFGDFVSK